VIADRSFTCRLKIFPAGRWAEMGKRSSDGAPFPVLPYRGTREDDGKMSTGGHPKPSELGSVNDPRAISPRKRGRGPRACALLYS
jgi:hypothetical protein